jgi:hypothetical protein
MFNKLSYKLTKCIGQIQEKNYLTALCIHYSIYFKDEHIKNRVNSIGEMFKLIKEKYCENIRLGEINISQERVTLKDKVNRYSNTSLMPFTSILVSVMVTYGFTYLTMSKSTELPIVLKSLTAMVSLLLVFIVYYQVSEMNSEFHLITRRNFYLICLEVVESIESDNLNINQQSSLYYYNKEKRYKIIIKS